MGWVTGGGDSLADAQYCWGLGSVRDRITVRTGIGRQLLNTSDSKIY